MSAKSSGANSLPDHGTSIPEPKPMRGLLTLEGPAGKLRRAHQHLEDLNAQIVAYLVSNPYSITVDVDPEAGKQFHRIHTKPFPVTGWALIIGDCVHNGRSALDHAVWSLAFHFNPASTPGDRTTAFPIFSTRKGWEDRGLRTIRRLPPRLQTLIKWVQPFRRKDSKHHPLAILHDLDKEDKHKVLTITVAAANTTRIRVRIGDTGDSRERSDTVRLGAFENGAIIAEGPAADLKMNVHPQLDIAFRDITDPKSGLPMPVVGGLKWMLSCVGSVLDDLDRFASSHQTLPPSTG